MKQILASIFISLLPLNPCLADWDGARSDGHAPIGVMGEHVHEEGEFMLSYRYMYMDMDGNLDGSSSISDQEVLESFPVTPTDMTMEMHMLGMMYAPSDMLTIMTMVPIVDIKMNHLSRMGREFKTTSTGLGDIKLTGLIKAADINDHRFIVNAGVSLPSGEIDERDDTPAMEQAQLPYPMQLGSGTVDLLPGLTYLGQTDLYSWGAQGIGTIRLGRNDNDYSLGNRFDSTVWSAYNVSEWVSASFRATWSIWGNVDGADPLLNPMMVPTADPDRRGGRRVDLGFGLNFYVPKGDLSGFRLAGEFLFPVYQHLDGPQLETDYSLIFGTQMAW